MPRLSSSRASWWSRCLRRMRASARNGAGLSRARRIAASSASTVSIRQVSVSAPGGGSPWTRPSRDPSWALTAASGRATCSSSRVSRSVGAGMGVCSPSTRAAPRGRRLPGAEVGPRDGRSGAGRGRAQTGGRTAPRYPPVSRPASPAETATEERPAWPRDPAPGGLSSRRPPRGPPPRPRVHPQQHVHDAADPSRQQPGRIDAPNGGPLVLDVQHTWWNHPGGWGGLTRQTRRRAGERRGRRFVPRFSGCRCGGRRRCGGGGPRSLQALDQRN